MPDNTLTKISKSVFADGLSLLGIPVATLQTLTRTYLEDQIDKAFSILLEELGAGNIGERDVADQNEVVAILHRFLIAARDGAARRNLRLLAKAVVGLAQRDRLFSDEFNRYAGILAQLTRDQILVLGRYHALWEQEAGETPDQEQARGRAWNSLIGELVPEQFPTADHVRYVCAQANGLGLLNAMSAFSSLNYTPSPLLQEIVALSDFQDVLRAEGEMPNGL